MPILTTVILLAVLSGLPVASYAEDLLFFYHHALNNNPSLKRREFGVDQAKAQKGLALSKLLPQVSAIGTYSLNDYHDSLIGTQEYDGTRGYIQARQALFDLSSFFRFQSADELIEQSKQELQSGRIDIAGEVVDRYLQALQAEDEIAYVEAEKAATESQMDRLRRMFERQLAKVTDLYEVEAYYQSLQTKEIEARNAKAVALEKLREISGLSAKNITALAQETYPEPPAEEEDWVIEATRKNPALRALGHAIEAARKMVSSGRSEHLPQLALVASETYADQGFDNQQRPPYTVGSLNLQLTVPLFEGGRVQATVREAAARYEIAREQYEEVRREIERETRTAYLDAMSSHAKIASTAQEVDAREKSSVAQQRGYEVGVITIVDVLETRRLLFKARTEHSMARYDYIRNLAKLHVNAGNLTEPMMAQFNSWLR
jgi:outer membrane protein